MHPALGPRTRSEDRGGTSIKHFCEMIHKSLVAEFQYALVWGTSSKHMPQRCAGAAAAAGAGRALCCTARAAERLLVESARAAGLPWLKAGLTR